MRSIIIVTNEDTMEPIEGAKVCLGFGWGFSKNVYTDEDGEAEIEHTSRASAEVFINGTYVGDVDAPTREEFFISE